MPNYDMIAIDLDGTLLNADRAVADTCRRAIDDARAAGIFVTVCTGRHLPECAFVLEDLCHADPVIVAGGAVIACPETRSTLHRFAIDADLTRSAVSHLNDSGHAVMVLKDASHTGYDYLMVVGRDEHPIDPVSAWWFEQMDVTVRTVRTLDEDDHPDHTVRIGVCALNRDLDPLLAGMRAVFADRATMHHFAAVVAPEHAERWGTGEAAHVLEIFDAKATKWSAIQHLARERGIDDTRIAAIGDEINDLSMISGAALGVAMGNARPEIKQVADRHTHTNNEGGVGHAIRQILDGHW